MIEIIPNWHPIFVHFTVALLSMSTVFYAATLIFPNHRFKDQWLAVAQWNLWTGALFAIATGFTGWLAFNSVAHDAESHLAMTDHRNWAIATLTIFLPLSVWSLWRARSQQKSNLIMVFIMAVGFGLLTSTAWRGGEAVYRYGLGVMQLPKTTKPVPDTDEVDKVKKENKTPKNADGHDHEHK